MSSSPKKRRPKIRVGFFLSTPMIGGAEKYLRDLLWGIDRHRFDVVLYTTKHPALESFLGLGRGLAVEHRVLKVRDEYFTREDMASDEQPRRGKGLRWRQLWHRIPNHRTMAEAGLRTLRYGLWPVDVRRTRQALSRDRLDVFHIVNGGYPGSLCAQAAAVASRDIGLRGSVMTVSSTPAAPVFLVGIERRIDRSVAAALDAVIAPALRSGRAMVVQRGFPAPLIRNFPLGIDLPPPCPEVRGAVRGRLGLPDTALVIGMVSNFTPAKGIGTLIEATAILRGREIDIYALVVGDGPYRRFAEAAVERHGLRDRVIFTGHSDNVHELLQAMDLFTLPSEAEGLSYAIIEAMSQAKPVVATRVGGIPDSAVDGETALLVPPRDPGALADALMTVLSDPALARRLGEAGRARYLDQFSLDMMIERHEQLYGELALRSTSTQ